MALPKKNAVDEIEKDGYGSLYRDSLGQFRCEACQRHCKLERELQPRKKGETTVYDALPRAAQGVLEFAVEPHLAAEHARISEKAGATFVYLLVDLEGAKLVADGKTPEYVRRQARSALEWTLEDAGRKAAGW